LDPITAIPFQREVQQDIMSLKQEDAPAYGSPAPSYEMEQPTLYSKYPTELPVTFPIGKKNVQPLVSVLELQSHLRLLGAFDRLKESVVEQHLPDGMDKEQAWVVFVNKAVHRFYTLLQASWPEGCVVASSEMTMPPLDVILVWHSYLLVGGHFSGTRYVLN
jgi:hypothetical protein